jgi:hypothetical protein
LLAFFAHRNYVCEMINFNLQAINGDGK